MKKLSFLLFLLLWIACKTDDVAQTLPAVKVVVPKELKEYYKEVDFTKTGNSLYVELANLTIGKHKNFLSYTDRHKHLYKAEASLKNPNNVVLVYTGEERYWKEYHSGSNPYKPQTFNTEHIYPQSKFKGDAKSDLHHLKVCDSKLNTSRSNTPFANGSGKAGRTLKGWYPGDEWKGDVARMIMYINLRYNDKIDNNIVVGGIDVLLKWNDEDPFSQLELQRNNVIEEAQGNRNPFIDFPQLARAAYQSYKP